MAEQKQMQVSQIKPGGYVILNSAPCVVKSIEKSKTGKHGAAKCKIEAIGLLDDAKRIEVHGAGDPIMVPIVEKKEAQVLSVSGETANVMDMATYETFDLKIPEDLKGIKEGDTVIYWEILDDKIIKQRK